MKLSEISPTAPSLIGRRGKRPHCKSADRGGFTWELGDLVFDDPMKLIGKSAKARAKARETWNDTGKKTRAKKSESSDYHRKHG
jgi:hypothetical protein